MADIEKLDRALEYIEAHPEEWDQTSYGRQTACGTVGCLAYVVGKLDGAPIKWDDEEYDGIRFIDSIGGEEPDFYACDSLHLGWDQADVLFAGRNTMAALKAIRDELSANPDASGETLRSVADEHIPPEFCDPFPGGR